ncbi:hypothetical protein F3Y22_tig00001777pilonHSYRG00014 [Hibiscus syriacus]|uniref:Transposase-associated domain-containing protein n=1 Tax=Hibiscus syriacus TaxID=106335 RepID=A0A6A3CWF2_HIBSY|nr:hypothetical protein F3Y22_tig00001777pilonHSYRG00014 [Hibiscus syriacus]
MLKFITFMLSKPRFTDRGNIRFSCNRPNCRDKSLRDPETVKVHVITEGFVLLYHNWVHHGEPFFYTGYYNHIMDFNTPVPEDAYDLCGSNHESNEVDVVGPELNAYMIEDDQPPTASTQMLYNKLGVSSEPIWSGSNQSKLSVRLMPEDNVMPKNIYETKKLVRDMDLLVQKIHCCINGCMIYWGSDFELSELTAKHMKWHTEHQTDESINDFPAYDMMSSWSIAERMVCPYCMEKSEAFTLQHGGKQSWFDNHGETKDDAKSRANLQLYYDRTELANHDDSDKPSPNCGVCVKGSNYVNGESDYFGRLFEKLEVDDSVQLLHSHPLSAPTQQLMLDQRILVILIRIMFQGPFRRQLKPLLTMALLRGPFQTTSHVSSTTLIPDSSVPPPSTIVDLHRRVQEHRIGETVGAFPLYKFTHTSKDNKDDGWFSDNHREFVNKYLQTLATTQEATSVDELSSASADLDKIFLKVAGRVSSKGRVFGVGSTAPIYYNVSNFWFFKKVHTTKSRATRRDRYIKRAIEASPRTSRYANEFSFYPSMHHPPLYPGFNAIQPLMHQTRGNTPLAPFVQPPNNQEEAYYPIPPSQKCNEDNAS